MVNRNGEIRFFPCYSACGREYRRSADWRPQHLLDIRRTRRQHHEAIETERDPGARGQAMVEGSQEVVVDRVGLAVKRPLRLVGYEASALFGGVGQLAESVGELEPANIDLEAL